MDESLRHYGFKDADLEEGWKRLMAPTGDKLSTPGPAKQDPSLLAELDAWENRWFPIASVSLRARFPEANAWLFLNLSQTEGPAVVISVNTFLDRLARMATEPSLGARGAEAVELLTQRGPGAATVQVACSLLDRLGTVAPAQAVATPDPEAQAKAEAAMWNWYLEWGAIAHVAVTDRRLLRELGFLKAKRLVSQEEEGESADAVRAVE